MLYGRSREQERLAALVAAARAGTSAALAVRGLPQISTPLTSTSNIWHPPPPRATRHRNSRPGYDSLRPVPAPITRERASAAVPEISAAEQPVHFRRELRGGLVHRRVRVVRQRAHLGCGACLPTAARPST